MTVRLDHLVFGRSPNPTVTGFRVLGRSEGIDSVEVRQLSRRANLGQALAYRTSEYCYEAFERLPSGRWVFSLRRPSRSRDGVIHPFCHMFVGSAEDLPKIGNPFDCFNPDQTHDCGEGQRRPLGSYTECERYRDFQGPERFPRLELSWRPTGPFLEPLIAWRNHLQRALGENLRVWLRAIYDELADHQPVALAQTVNDSLEYLVRWVWLGLPEADRLNTSFSTHVAPLQWADYDIFNVPREFRHHVSGATVLDWKKAQHLAAKSDPVRDAQIDWLLQPDLEDHLDLSRVFAEEGWRSDPRRLGCFVAYRKIAKKERPCWDAAELADWLARLTDGPREWLDPVEVTDGLIHHLNREGRPDDSRWDAVAKALDSVPGSLRESLLPRLWEGLRPNHSLPWLKALVAHRTAWSSKWARPRLLNEINLCDRLAADEIFLPKLASWLAEELQDGAIRPEQLDSLILPKSQRSYRLLSGARQRTVKFSETWIDLSERMEPEGSSVSQRDIEEAVLTAGSIAPRLARLFLRSALSQPLAGGWRRTLDTLQPDLHQIAECLDSFYGPDPSPSRDLALSEAFAFSIGCESTARNPATLLQLRPASMSERDFLRALLRNLAGKAGLPNSYAPLLLDCLSHLLGGRFRLRPGDEYIVAVCDWLLDKGYDERVAVVLLGVKSTVEEPRLWRRLLERDDLTRFPHTYWALVELSDEDTRAELADRFLENWKGRKSGQFHWSLAERWIRLQADLFLDRLGSADRAGVAQLLLDLLAGGTLPPIAARKLQAETLFSLSAGAGRKLEIPWSALAGRYPVFADCLMEFLASDPKMSHLAGWAPWSGLAPRLAIALGRGLLKGWASGRVPPPSIAMRGVEILERKARSAKYMEKRILMTYGERLNALHARSR